MHFLPTCLLGGLYLHLAEVLVGKTGVPGVKTTVKVIQGVFPLEVRGGSPYCVYHSMWLSILWLVSFLYILTCVESKGGGVTVCVPHISCPFNDYLFFNLFYIFAPPGFFCIFYFLYTCVISYLFSEIIILTPSGFEPGFKWRFLLEFGIISTIDHSATTAG